ncbi:MAG: pyridoxal phosphate-dependent aminotransferase [Calditrichota bacterium]
MQYYIVGVEASKTLQVKEKALELKARGIDVIDLTAGEPDFNTPENICRAGIDAINKGFTKYTANTGIPKLREAICAKLKSDNDLTFTPEQIVVSNGAKQSILNALFAIINPGDEVILPMPYWVSYTEQIKLAGGIPSIIDTTKTGFKLSPNDLTDRLNSRTKAIIINSPSNPTGIVYTSEELAVLAEILAKYDVWIITDEIYEKIIFDGLQHTSIASFGDLLQKSIVINGFSKSHAMTGWRLGYSAAPLSVTHAGLAALQTPVTEIEKMREEFEIRRNKVISILKSRDYFSFAHPQGAFYFFVKVSDVFGSRIDNQVIDSSVKFSAYITENYHVVTVPGIAFGSDDYIRISFATSLEQLELGMGKLISAMDNLRTLKKTN